MSNSLIYSSKISKANQWLMLEVNAEVIFAVGSDWQGA